MVIADIYPPIVAKNEYIFSTKNQNIEEKVEEAQFDEEIE